jgi:hypothetical protein
MLHALSGAGDFGWSAGNMLGARPLATTYGHSITPGNNTKGTYVQLLAGASVARDVFGVYVVVSANAVSTAARDTLLDIGVDPAGGSSYSVLLPDLLVSSANTYLVFGIAYYFPIWIRAGSSVAARASVNNATVGTLRTAITVYGSPKDRRLVRVGTKCKAYGIDAANSTGTAITSGTTSEGSWTALGSTVSERNWWWQLGFGINNAAMTNVIYHCDLAYGDATNNVMLFENRLASTTTLEQVSVPLSVGGDRAVPSGGTCYGRMQASATPDAGLSLAAYGVSG